MMNGNAPASCMDATGPWHNIQYIVYYMCTTLSSFIDVGAGEVGKTARQTIDTFYFGTMSDRKFGFMTLSVCRNKPTLN